MSGPPGSVKFDGDIAEWAKFETKGFKRAVQSGIRDTTLALKDDWRGQVRASGLPSSLGNSIRAEVYPKGRNSANAAGLVYTKSPKLTAVFDEGAIIRARNSRWLAIPTRWAGRRGPGVKFPSPAEWSERTGIKLRFVSFGHGQAALVAENAWGETDKKGTLKAKRNRRRGKSSRYHSEFLTIFILVPQVKLAKRTGLMSAADRIGATVPDRIIAAWRD